MDKRSSRGGLSRPDKGEPRAPVSLEVYPPREDTHLVLGFAHVPAGTTLVEVGAGNGLSSLAAARGGAHVVATDLNRTALERLQRTAREEGIDLAVVRTDLLAGLRRFERVLANPPYLPTGSDEVDPDPGTRLALDGGPDGCRVLGRLVRTLADHLAPAGSAFVLVSSLQDEWVREAILARWRTEGGLAEVVAARTLEGERLEVLRLWRPMEASGAEGPTRGPGHRRRPRRGSAGRRRTPTPSRPASSRAPAR